MGSFSMHKKFRWKSLFSSYVCFVKDYRENLPGKEKMGSSEAGPTALKLGFEKSAPTRTSRGHTRVRGARSCCLLSVWHKNQVWSVVDNSWYWPLLANQTAVLVRRRVIWSFCEYMGGTFVLSSNGGQRT